MSNNILPKYTFLPWLRKGISTQITDIENQGAGNGTTLLRSDVTTKVKLTGEGIASASETVTQTAALFGPGDVVGVSQDAIIKTEPEHFITNFEPNYLASIDFYDEDFLWRYSPAKQNADDQLRPWMTLIVLKEDEFENEDPTQSILPSIKIILGKEASFLPKYDETSAWAHVHVNADLDTQNTGDINDALSRLEELIDIDPDIAISRLVCPRKLDENTAYHAFLIPTYETGRLAGLGVAQSVLETIPAQMPSWGGGAAVGNHTVEIDRWPIYFNWYFKTGEEGDFEFLVRKLVPQPMDNQVGRRPVDLQNPGHGLNYQLTIDDPEDPGNNTIDKTTLSLEGALTVPGTQGEEFPFPDKVADDVNYDSSTDTDLRVQIQDLVNLGTDLKDTQTLGTLGNSYATKQIGGKTVEEDPLITPPIYGAWHALTNKVDAFNTDAVNNKAGWLHELNLDPRNRIVANIGTQVLQTQQETLMDEAWGQMGDVIDANKKLYWAQMARETSRRIYKKHISSQPREKAWAMTGKMKRQVLNNDASPETYFAQAKKSQLAVAAEDRAIRRFLRPGGPIMKRMDPAQLINSSSDNLVNKLDNKVIVSVDDKVEPPQAQTMSLSAMSYGITNQASIDTSSSNFAVAEVGNNTPQPPGNNSQGSQFQTSISDLSDFLNASNWPQPASKPIFDIDDTADIKQKINPLQTLSRRVYRNILLDNEAAASPPDKIVPVMAYPKFRKPMYTAIRDLSTDLLIPNLDLVPNNCISLLQTNQKFIESYMVGLNHEMGRELLWREYPTDQRGTYFRQFWSIADNVNTTAETEPNREDQLYDIPEIHQWLSNTELGTHGNSSSSNTDKLVLIIRGDLLRKYPNAVIYAVPAMWQTDASDNPLYDSPRIPSTAGEMYPIFGANINPDLNFIGFDLLPSDVQGGDPEEYLTNNTAITDADAGYFFVIKERPGQIRFGMDIEPDASAPAASFDTWNDLHWGRISSTERIELGGLIAPPTNSTAPVGAPDPGTTPPPAPNILWSSSMNASDMAMVLYQNPVMVSVHASEMLQNL